MLSSIADIADLIAAAAIIVSLLFVAYEIRATRKQAELTNWRETLNMMIAHKAQTNDPEFAAIVAKGHADYAALTGSEKVAFGHYLEEGIHVYGNFLKHNDSLPRKLLGMEEAITNHFYELLATPGGAAWWEEAQPRRRFMADTYTVTNSLLEKRGKNDGRPV